MTQIYILILVTAMNTVTAKINVSTVVIKGFPTWASCGAAADKAKKSAYVRDAFCIAQDKYK